MTEQVRPEDLGLIENRVVPHPAPTQNWPSIPPLDSTLSVPLPLDRGPSVPIPDLFF